MSIFKSSKIKVLSLILRKRVESQFYSRIFQFELAGEVAPVVIENMPSR